MLPSMAARDQRRHQGCQQRRTAGVQQRRQQRPVQHHVRQAGQQLQRGQAEQRARRTRGAGLTAQRQPEGQQRRQHDHRAEPVRHVDGGQRLEGQHAAVGQMAQRPAQREAGLEVHRRPPPALAGRNVLTGQHRIVGADPAAQRDLQHQQGQHAPGGTAQSGRQLQRLRIVALHLHRQQHQQADAAEQMRGDDGRIELHRDGERAEGALQADPDEAQRRPARRDARGRGRIAAAQPPHRQCAPDHQHRHQRADAGGQIAVDHLDPGLAMGDRAGGHRGLGLGDLGMCAQRAGAAVAAGPVRAAQAGVAQPGEGAEQHQIEGQHQRQQRQCAQPLRRAGAAVAPQQPAQRQQRQRGAEAEHLQQRIEVDAGRGRGSRRAHRAHRAAPSPTMAGSRPARSQELEARSSRSRSRLALAGSKSAGSRIIHMPIGSTR